MIVFSNHTQSLKCTECREDIEVSRKIFGNPEAFVALVEHLNRVHSNGCPARLIDPIERLPEIDWQIDIQPLGVIQ